MSTVVNPVANTGTVPDVSKMKSKSIESAAAGEVASISLPLPFVPPTSPEQDASWLSRATFWWMNSILFKGMSRPLEDSDCYQLKPSLRANQLAEEFDREWAVEKILAEERKKVMDQARLNPTSEQSAAAAKLKLQQAKEQEKKSAEEEKKKKTEAAGGTATAPGVATAKPDEIVPPPRTPDEPSLGAALWRAHSKKFWLAGLCKAITDGLQLLQPMLLQMLLTFLIDWEYNPQFGVNRPEEWKGFVLVAFIGICPLVGGLLENAHQHLMTTIGFTIRTVLVEKMYMKSLVLSPAARTKFSTGKIINTMSSDTFLIDQFAQYAHLCWSAVCQIIVAIALLINAIGWSAIVGLSVIFVSLPIAGVIMARWMALYGLTAPIKDSRVKLINEILQGIRVIKVYVWESSFLGSLLAVRARELALIRSQQYLFIWTTTLWTCTPLLISLVSFITLGLATESFTPTRVFTAISLFNVLRMPMMMGPAAMAQCASAAVSLRRIEYFLLAEELQWIPEVVQVGSLKTKLGKTCAVQVKNGTFTWESAASDAAVGGGEDAKSEEVSSENKIVVVVDGAPISPSNEEKESYESDAVPMDVTVSNIEASKKGTFKLHDINFEIESGSLVCIVGSVGSGKSSLLSALLGEMRRLEGSVTFSGRTAYCAQQSWIQNATLRENVLFGKPIDSQRYADALHYSALEHDISMLPGGDHTEIGEKGITLSGGQKARTGVARAIYSDAEVLLLDDPLSAVDAHVGNFLFHSCIRDYLRSRTRILVTHQLQFVQHSDLIICMDGGRIAETGSYSELVAANGAFAKLINEYGKKDEEDDEVEIVAADTTDGKSKGLRKRHGSSASRLKRLSTKSSKAAEPTKDKMAVLMQSEERERGGVALDVYLFYFKAGGGFAWATLAFFLLCCAGGSDGYGGWWVSEWSEDKHHQKQGFYVGIYAAIGIAQIIFTLLMMSMLTSMSVRASRDLHAQSFERILRAPAWFFGQTRQHTTPLGRILNRFSRDQDLIDSQLMRMIQNVFSMLTSLSSMLIIIAIVIPWILIPFTLVIFIYVIVERAFRHSNRELKRIESLNRSPLYAHFAETLTGLTTIRAYAAQSIFTSTHMQRLDSANRSTYLQLMTQRWLGVRVETMSAIVAFFAALLVVIQRDTIGAGKAGLAVSYAISLPLLLNWLVRCTSEAESGMSAVERAKYYAQELPQESAAVKPTDEALKRRQPIPWPSTGSIRFENVKLRYRPDLPLVLKGVSFEIKSRERIGVVGRTGAGKSSLMVALYRMVELASSESQSGGRIFLDGIDIASIGLDLLRGAMAIIPQDAILFSGTIRSNLDPFNNHTNEQVWNVLERVHLSGAIRALPNGLDNSVSEGGENLSAGQKAMLTLARAMLRDTKVLIMDEATASIDMQTDTAIQLSLRTEFADKTLITIAHRLHTIIDYDRVCVMSDGVVSEFDTPANLLRNSNSMFRKMVDDTGAANAELLTTLALRAEAGRPITGEQLQSGALLSPNASSYIDECTLPEISTIRWHAAEDD